MIQPQQHNRRDWAIFALLLMLGLAAMFCVGQLAVSAGNTWSADVGMHSNINPLARYVVQLGTPVVIEPVSQEILTPIPWKQTYLTPGAGGGNVIENIIPGVFSTPVLIEPSPTPNIPAPSETLQPTASLIAQTVPTNTITPTMIVIIATPTQTATNNEPVPTITPSITSTRTLLPTGTATLTRTTSPTLTSTVILTATPTPTRTYTLAPSATVTRTVTASPTVTRTTTATAISTPIPSLTATSTLTATPVLTATSTNTPTYTFTVPPTGTATSTATAPATATLTPTVPPTATSTSTATPLPTSTSTFTPLPTHTPTLSPVATSTYTPVPSATPTPIANFLYSGLFFCYDATSYHWNLLNPNLFSVAYSWAGGGFSGSGTAPAFNIFQITTPLGGSGPYSITITYPDSHQQTLNPPASPFACP